MAGAAGCAVGALVVGAAVMIGIIDYWAHLPNLVRRGAGRRARGRRVCRFPLPA